MKNYKPVVLASLISAIIISLTSIWVFEGDWPFLPYILLAGISMAVVQKASRTREYLLKLILGSLLFGFLLVFLITLRMWAVSQLFYDSSFPLFFFLSKEMLIMALVSAFAAGLGGLLGVVLKGLFFLYKNKLDIAVVILGPMILMLASLFIIKVKIGGTIMSALHGWPYPFWVLEARDVVDGFGIDRWIFSPGSYFHYIIFDYLFYIAILALVYYAIKIINKKAVVKKINTTFALFGALAIMVLVVSSFMSIWRANISRAIARAGDCQTDADCVIVGSVCPFSCAIVANIAEAGRIEKMARAFPSTCELNCLGQETAVCEENKCRVSNGSGSEKSSGTEWQRIIDAINKCEAVSAAQAHSLSVSVKLKSGEEIEAVEPVIDDIFRVADEARSRCGEIIMATE